MARTTRRFLAWDAKFTKRNETLYAREDLKLIPVPGQTPVDVFLTQRVHGLMPVQYSYAALREFLERDPNHLNRRKGEFQASFSACAGDEKEFFHEAQISVLLVGIDEWVWTLYCLVETHFSETGSENVRSYIDSNKDAPSGAAVDSSMPIWNPREYFLLVLSRRMSEARFEWANLVETLETRFRFLDEDTFSGPSTKQTSTQDNDLKLTNDFTWAIQVLQLFSNQIIKTIEVWDEFSDKHLHILHPVEAASDFLPKIPSYLESLDTDVSELRFIYRTIMRRMQAFESKRANILNTSALVEARASNSQADNIGLLTKVTVFYLPLGLITAVFSMAFIPSSLNWRVYIGVLIGFTLLSVLVSFNLAWFLGISAPLELLARLSTFPAQKGLSSRPGRGESFNV